MSRIQQDFARIEARVIQGSGTKFTRRGPVLFRKVVYEF